MQVDQDKLNILQVHIADMLRTRGVTCGVEGQRKKWAAEEKLLPTEPYAKALAEIGFDPKALEGLAIYATVKLRRLVGAYLGAGKPDPYTEVLLRNAKALAAQGKPFSHALMNATLTTRVRADEPLRERRQGSEGTASTQASSTRQALLALGAGHNEGKGRHATFVVDLSHPFVAKVLDA